MADNPTVEESLNRLVCAVERVAAVLEWFRRKLEAEDPRGIDMERGGGGGRER